MPLVSEAFDWEHGTFLGATMSVETTAAAAGEVGQLRFDPMAMLPFSGYNMADYFAHWLKIGEREGAKLPKVFLVNWFRKDAEGKFIWPGFGENSRVLEWVFRRCDGEGETVESPIGLLPAEGEIDTEGLDISDDADARAALGRRRPLQATAPAGQGAPSPLRRQAPTSAEPAAEGPRAAPRGITPLGRVASGWGVFRRPKAAEGKAPSRQACGPGPRSSA